MLNGENAFRPSSLSQFRSAWGIVSLLHAYELGKYHRRQPVVVRANVFAKGLWRAGVVCAKKGSA